MKYKSFFLSEKYKHPHKRHDPIGSEDGDVNNDGKVDINDKYLMAKRRLYQQYKQMQKSKKTSDFSVPQLENNMIRLTGLVDLSPIKEETHEPTHTEKDSDNKEMNKSARMEMMLKKLKEMQMSPEQEKKVDEMIAKMETLVGGQKKLDMDKDGKLTAKDFEILRNKKDEVVNEDDISDLEGGEEDVVGEDHEVSMAQNLINDIIKNATELKGKVGMQERNLPAWIQDHISQAQNFISQANTNFHESDEKKTDSPKDKDMNTMAESVKTEAAPEGWEKTVVAMKKHKEIDNPWALAHWMKKKGYQSKKES